MPKSEVFTRYKHRGEPYMFIYSTVGAKVSAEVLPGDFDIRHIARKIGPDFADSCKDFHDKLMDRETHKEVLRLAKQKGVPLKDYDYDKEFDAIFDDPKTWDENDWDL